jgi:hypothetical protein
MNPLDDILNRLAALPADVQKEIVETAMAATAGATFVPNPGPQTDAWFSEADELFYGGQAGGGKSALGCGLAYESHERTLILRRYNKDAKKLADAEFIGKIRDGDRDGWNGSDLVYRDDRRHITFGGCEMEQDKQRYKGDPHDLICVGRGTLVLLADGRYCPVEDLRVGQMVQTLEGPRKLQRVHPIQMKPCVEVVARDSKGREIARQIQSTTHPLLSENDWLSAADQIDACQPTQCRGIGTLLKSCWVKCESLSMYLAVTISDSWHKGGLFRRFFDLQFDGEKISCGQQLALEIDFSACCDHNQDFQQPLLSFAHQALSEPYRLLSWRAFFHSLFLCDERDAEKRSLLADFLSRCWCGIRQCGERIRQWMGRSTAKVDGPQCLLLRDDVEQPSPTRLPKHGLAGTRKHTHQQDKYVHPYTKEIRQVAVSGSLQRAALEFSFVGLKEVFDLQIEEVNHYITFGGFVNKNCFDEVTDFLESQYVFITIWNRSATQGQRCRVVCTGNPPTSAEGLWVIKRWAPWLDPKHHNPAKPGELRWFLSDEDGADIEVDGPGPHQIGGKDVYAKSRTFIPAKLSDNPDLSADGQYERVLDALPKELREAYRDGRFDAGLKDHPWQLIPTQWVIEAQARWKPMPPTGIPMCAIAADVAQGGADNNVIAARYDSWFSELQIIPGSQTPLGKDISGEIVKHRRDGALIIIDCGGGYGGSAYKHFHDNNDPVVAYKGATGSSARTKDGTLTFANKRSECLWRFREALDPSALGGSQIALPPDPVLLSDLTAVHYEVKKNVIHAEPKEDVAKRIGRSPDRGDAVVMCWTEGARMASHHKQWTAGNRPSVNYGHAKARRKR